MPQGISLHIGLNLVDPAHYGGWSGQLNACEADAEDMSQIANSKGFTSTTLLTANATRSKVSDALDHAASTLREGDIFFLSYSGHGGQLPDQNSEEDDGLDETWCLYDGQMVDDELYQKFGTFAKGVRIFVLSDSCHSGTTVREAYRFGQPSVLRSETSEAPRIRAMPREVARRTYLANQDFYDPILKDRNLAERQAQIGAMVLLISGCQDNQVSLDGPFNGLFTSKLLQVWNNGAFSDSYRQFHKKILGQMPPTQSPNFFRVGNMNVGFERERPFSI